MNEEITDKITRFEVIDESGRVLVYYNIEISLKLQDDGKTLKIFLTDKNKLEECGNCGRCCLCNPCVNDECVCEWERKYENH